jgi:hypothetical protein
MAVESYQDVGRRWSGDLGCGRRNPLFPVRTRFTSPTAPEFCSFLSPWSSPIRGIDRLGRFGFIQCHSDTLSVLHFVDLVTEGRVRKLSPPAQRVDCAHRHSVASVRFTP